MSLYLFQIESTKFQGLPRLESFSHESLVSLASIALRLSRDCSHYKCELTFSNVSKMIIARICIEPALGVKVYDWWVPNYATHIHSNESQYQAQVPQGEQQVSNGNNSNNNDDPWYD